MSAVVGGEGESIGVLSVDSKWDLYSVHAEHPLVCNGHCVHTIHYIIRI